MLLVEESHSRKYVINKKGFTLLEVLVAMSIMVGGIIVINQAWSGNLLRKRKSSLNYNVALLLERKTAEIEAKYQGKTLEEIPENEGGDFGDGYGNYSWTFTTQEFAMPDLTPLLTKDGGVDEMLLTMIKQMSEYINKSILEGTITVILTSGERQVKYALTTYFVDYNRNIPIGPGGGGQ